MIMIKTYLISIITFFAIDMVWLGVVARNLYAKHLGFLMKTDINWIAALSFYFLFVAGLVFFVIHPALEKQSLFTAVVTGAFFGLIAYATYDLTNLATIKDWPILITAIDMIWGAVLASLVSAISYLIAMKVGV